MVLMTGSGCSYVMDTIEGAITNRSSFSIKVEPLGGNTYRIDWSAAGTQSGEDFAGYEVYITDEPDNELAGYRCLAGYYELETGFTMTDSSLANGSTQSCDVTFPGMPNTLYYFRVGIIKWSEEKNADRQEKWTTSNGYDYDWSSSYGSTANRYYYDRKTDLSKISGACPVEF